MEQTNEKKDSIRERIDKRNKERLNYLDVKLEQRNKENLQLEGADYFAQTFNERVHQIENHLFNINEAAAKKLPQSAENKDLVQTFSNITIQIQELQRYLTNSTMFLTDYKIKACQTILNDLYSSSEEIRLRLLPKKKFGFSGKKVTTKEKLNPKVADLVDGKTALHAAGEVATKRNAFTWTLSNRSNEHIILKADEVNDKDITIANLQDCLVELQGHAGSVQLSHTKNCILLCGPVARSLFAEHCNNFTVAVACQQMRLHSSSHCRLYLQVTCRAIIEDCTHIDISEYAYQYEGLEADFEHAGLERGLNNYKDIADFNWLSPDVHSPNWQMVEENLKPDWQKLREEFKQKAAANLLS